VSQKAPKSRATLSLPTRVTLTPEHRFNITVDDEPSAEGGLRARLATVGYEVWIDAPELRQLRDFLNEILGDED